MFVETPLVCHTDITMAQKIKTSAEPQEGDSAYLLKLVLYVILGSLWLRLPEPLQVGGISIYALPIGLVVGLLFASHDHFQIDRKIEYVVLILVAIIGLYLPTGIVL